MVSAYYSPEENAIKLKFYDDEKEEILEWIDKDFKAFFYSDTPVQIEGIIRKKLVRRYHPLLDKEISVWQIFVDSPSRVKQTHSLELAETHKFWHNHIKFFQNYIYCNNIWMCMPYEIIDGELYFAEDDRAEARMLNIKVPNLSPIMTRFIRFCEYPAPNFKRASLDIEVYNEKNQIPNANIANLPVICACSVTSDNRKIAYVLYRGGEVEIPSGVNEVQFFTEEKELIEAIFKLFDEYPFIITFNGDDFDLKYLYHRAKRLGIKDIPIELRERMTLLKKGIHIDIYRFLSINAIKIYAFKGAYKDNDLDSIAEALLGKRKKKIDVPVGELSIKDLVDYCLWDAELTYELTSFKNNILMNLIILIARLSSMPIENVTRKSISKWITSILYREHIMRDYLIPTKKEIMSKGGPKSRAMIKGKKYKGAIVFEPKAGVYFDVLVLDFASLYPSIIKVYNVGYETVNCPHKMCQDNKKGDLEHWICKIKKSLESEVVGALRDLRVGWYKKKAKVKSKYQSWYSVVEQTIKVIMNASYGVFGSDIFPLYCPPAAEMVTSIARHIISETAKKAEEMGIEVLYGDTDSIFVVRPKDERLIEELVEWVEKTFQIDFEKDKEFKYVCLSSRKKNYLGVFKDGRVDVKGMTGKKKHTPKLIKDAFEEVKKVLSEINTPQEMEEGKRKIIKILQKVYLTLKQRKWENIEDLAFSVTLGKNLSEYLEKGMPQHVRLALRLVEEKGVSIGAGSVVKYIKTSRKICGSNIKGVEETRDEEVDIQKYIEFLRSTFEQILEPLDLDFNEHILGYVKLSQWFN